MIEIFNFMVNNGVPRETITLLLMLPIIATLIVAIRQIAGIKAFGIYTPLIITFAFFDTGIKYGLAIFLTVLIVGTLVRFMVRRFRLLYLPRMGIVLTIIAIVILLILFEGALSKRTVLVGTSIFPILIMVTLAEKFIAAQIEKGVRTAIILSLETLLVSIIGYYLITWNRFQELVFLYPQLIILSLVINILLGRWSGLRISEYFRFKEILKKS